MALEILIQLPLNRLEVIIGFIFFFIDNSGNMPLRVLHRRGVQAFCLELLDVKPEMGGQVDKANCELG